MQDLTSLHSLQAMAIPPVLLPQSQLQYRRQLKHRKEQTGLEDSAHNRSQEFLTLEFMQSPSLKTLFHMILKIKT